MRAHISDHAVVRYRERVKSHLDRVEARSELERLIEMCPGPTDSCPLRLNEEADAFAEIAPGIWLVLVEERGGWLATSCLTNGTLSEPSRRNRNAEKRKRRSAKRFRKFKNGRRVEDGVW